MRAIAEIDKPLIAAVQGRAVGVGTTMLLHCDLVILADDAKLTTPFVNLGLVPEAASSRLLPARIGHLRAFSMLALGEAVEARDPQEQPRVRARHLGEDGDRDRPRLRQSDQRQAAGPRTTGWRWWACSPVEEIVLIFASRNMARRA